MSNLTDAIGDFVRDPTGQARQKLLDQEVHSGPPKADDDDLARLSRACVMAGTTGFEEAILRD